MDRIKKILIVCSLVLLVILNIFAFLILGAMFFFGFDLQWGLNIPAITWGLPIFFGTIALLWILYLLIKRKKLLLGVYGICVAVGLNVYLGLLLFYCPSLLLPKQVNVPEQYFDSEENEIITLVLKNMDSSFGYTVVHPETSMGSSLDASRVESYKNIIKHEFNTVDYDFSMLSDQFFKANEKPTLLNIRSSPEHGYYIDYDNRFTRYFQSGFGWIQLRISHPFTAGMTEISLPAYDPKTGYFLISVGRQFDWLAGFGAIYAYKYENGQLIYIKSFNTWIS